MDKELIVVTLTQDDVDLKAPPISDEDKKEKRIAVVEIFGPTIQGEGPLAGAKTMFVRFGGCDYRCQKCDSLHAVIPAAVKKNARYLKAQEIVDELTRLREGTGTVWVTLSGGNPVMWDLSMLVSLLHGAGFAVAVETQGTLWQPWLTRAQMVVISPKSPGMGERFDEERFAFMVNALWAKKVAVGVKVVVFSQQDIDFAVDVNEIMLRGEAPPGQEGMMFLSLGNPFPPVLDENMVLQDSPALHNEADPRYCGMDHRLALLQEYKILVEDFVRDPRVQHFRFLPQIHVLLYSNEASR